MESTELRTCLRRHTEDLHRTLDAAIGPFTDLSTYGQFLSRSFRFRRMVEPALSSLGSWTVQPLVPHIALDLADLGLDRPAGEAVPLELGSEPANIGALYVLEGSTLGARLLFARAMSLGLSEHWGARSLAKQANATDRWRKFLIFLQSCRDVDPVAAVAGAKVAFEQALLVYTEAR